MTVHFKLKFKGQTRRVAFPQPPDWPTLSAKLRTLYAIPVDDLGVSYIDQENDEITLSSDEELQDYYLGYYHPDEQGGNTNNAIKFNVLNLASLRDSSSRQPSVSGEQPTNSTPRANFAGFHDAVPDIPIATLDIDDEWQNLHNEPVFVVHHDFEPNVGFGSPHAYVETVEGSDAGMYTDRIMEVNEPSRTGSTAPPASVRSEGDQLVGRPPSSAGIPSTESVIGSNDEGRSVKHPIHIMNRGSPIIRGELVEVESVQLVAGTVSGHEHPDFADDPSDPPLPTINESASTNTAIPNSSAPNVAGAGDVHPSLTQDVAALLASVTNIIQSHPEVSNIMRNIVRNSASGAYWATHRENIARSVREIEEEVGARSEEFRRNAEAEAARRISSTLGNFFRSLASHYEQPSPETTAEGAVATPEATANATEGQTDPSIAATPIAAVPSLPSQPDVSAWLRFPLLTHPPPQLAFPPPPPPIHPFVPPPPPLSVPPPPPPPALFPPLDFSPVPPPPMNPLFDTLFGNPFIPTAPNRDAADTKREQGGTTTSSVVPDATSNTDYRAGPPKGPSRFSGSGPRSSGLAPPRSAGAEKIWEPENRPSWLPVPPSPIVGVSERGGGSDDGKGSEGAQQKDKGKSKEVDSKDEKEKKRATAQELRESVEAAKALYKAEKERYRREREERKKMKESERKRGVNLSSGTEMGTMYSISREPSGDPKSPDALSPMLISNARGPFPQLELVGLQRHQSHGGHSNVERHRSATPGSGLERSTTHGGHAHSHSFSHRHGHEHGLSRRVVSNPHSTEDPIARAAAKITKRLADMGFTESTFPELPGKIRTMLGLNDKPFGREKEDDIVTTLLEELLASPRSPVASGSGTSVPGGWQ